MATPRYTAPALQARDEKFYLNGLQFRILSGAMHYFRIHPDHWHDRLLKLRACGLNTVETYIAWNIHEPIPGQFDFDGLKNVRKFVMIAQELGLKVILRPGPFICAEWDFGGLPGWLLRDPGMRVRSSYQPYLDAVERYLYYLLPTLVDLQASRGGPIIAWQLENEYGSYGRDRVYKEFLREKYLMNGVTEMLFTSDNGVGIRCGEVPGELITANFQERDHGFLLFEYLKHVKQPGMPLMAMEFWSGWFNHWGEKHHVWPPERFEEVLRWILDQGASVNFYMFHGGTNFGFMNGANQDLGATNENVRIGYMADTTSYDYDAPLSENGDITPKYEIIKRVLKEKVPQFVPSTFPPIPANIPAHDYGQIQVLGHMTLEDLIRHMKPQKSFKALPMEQLHINDDAGQSYGYVLYRTLLGRGKQIIFQGTVADRAQVFINGSCVGIIEPGNRNHGIHHVMMSEKNVLDVLVENMGRVNYAENKSPVLNDQRKGIRGDVKFDGKDIRHWEIYSLEMKEDYIESLTTSGRWRDGLHVEQNVPSMSRMELILEDEPKDTHINMTGWGKGQVFVNSFNLGRYWSRGPQQTLYIPGPLLKQGLNHIVLFEQEHSQHVVTLESRPRLGDTIVQATPLSDWERQMYGAMKWLTEKWPWSWNLLRLVLK